MTKTRGIESVGLCLQWFIYGVCPSSHDKNINIRVTGSSVAQRMDTCHRFICRKGTNKDVIIHAP